MAGDLLVVGAPYANNDPGPTTASGRAFIYRLVGGIWQFEKLLTAPTPQSNAHFGLAVAVSTQTVPVVVVGEPDRDDANGDDVGYVWIWTYVNGAWQNTDVKYVIHAGDPAKQVRWDLLQHQLLLLPDRRLGNAVVGSRSACRVPLPAARHRRLDAAPDQPHAH